jgi:hypothetical protein
MIRRPGDGFREFTARWYGEDDVPAIAQGARVS